MMSGKRLENGCGATEDIIMAWLFFLSMEDLMFKLHFEDCDEETYSKMMESLKEVDLSKIREDEDNTDLKGEIACGGGACEVI